MNIRMKRLTILAAFATLLVPAFAADNFQIKSFGNLISGGDSFINMSNTGSSWFNPPPRNMLGNICVNTYVFARDVVPSNPPILQACCSCLLKPNELASYSLNNNLISNTFTQNVPNEVVVKFVVTLACDPQANGTCTASSSGTSCNPATLGAKKNPITGMQPFAAGLVAWGTGLHALPSGGYGVTETAFEKGTLTTNELTTTALPTCAKIQDPVGNPTGAGICKPCNYIYR